ncbi:MAG: helix-turn-helix domain-containing protein [Acidobacteriota bacterium]|nr:helix-turn-helix domain-containing protein [Acidobacteriota bacterium]
MNDTKTTFEKFIEDAERRRIFEQESLAFEATELISSLMEEQKIKKSDLAKRIGKSKAYVTQLLSGTRNMTLHTFADLVFALGHKVEFNVAPQNEVATGLIVHRYHVSGINSFHQPKLASHWKSPKPLLVEGQKLDWVPMPGLGSSDTAHAA